MIAAEEAATALRFATDKVACHTDIVLVLKTQTGEEAKQVGLSSCILLEFRGRIWALSSEHVASQGDAYFIGPARLERDIIPEGTSSQVVASRLAAISKELDLAVFEIPSSLPSFNVKQPYLLSASDWITEELIYDQISTAAFICAAPGIEASLHQYQDRLVYLQAPLYSAIGPIVSCSRSKIVADFSEREVLFLNTSTFPQLSKFAPTGGVRDLRGISGSGLWVRKGDSMYLAGVVQGRDEGAYDQHLVRCTSIWALRQWLELAVQG